MPKKPAPRKGAAAKAAHELPRIQWPLLQPMVPVADLSLDVVLENQIVVIHKLFTASLARQFVSFCSNLPLTTTSTKPKRDEALRFNDRLQVDDHEFAQTLWESTALKHLVGSSPDADWGGEVIGLSPRIRIYRYGQGQYFDCHYDESNVITIPTTPPTPAKTTWTLLLYLTGPETGCSGGETVFYPEHGQARDFSKNADGPPGANLPISIVPETGMALLHKHGNDCMLHEGKEVTAGYKWILRSDLCVKR